MNRQILRIARLVGGTVLVIIGVIGGFIPILQGWVFILAGLTLMAPESRRAQAALDWAKRKVGVSSSKDTARNENDKTEEPDKTEGHDETNKSDKSEESAELDS